MSSPDPVIVAFDGECLMCSRTIRFCAERDPHERLRFTALQSERGEAMRERFGPDTPDSILVDSEGRILDRSDAALAIARVMAQPWRGLGRIAALVPRPLRNAIYDFVARNRIRWFGKGDACAMPSEALRRRLL